MAVISHQDLTTIEEVTVPLRESEYTLCFNTLTFRQSAGISRWNLLGAFTLSQKREDFSSPLITISDYLQAKSR